MAMKVSKFYPLSEKDNVLQRYTDISVCRYMQTAEICRFGNFFAVFAMQQLFIN